MQQPVSISVLQVQNRKTKRLALQDTYAITQRAPILPDRENELGRCMYSALSPSPSERASEYPPPTAHKACPTPLDVLSVWLATPLLGAGVNASNFVHVYPKQTRQTPSTPRSSLREGSLPTKANESGISKRTKQIYNDRRWPKYWRCTLFYRPLSPPASPIALTFFAPISPGPQPPPITSDHIPSRRRRRQGDPQNNGRCSLICRRFR